MIEEDPDEVINTFNADEKEDLSTSNQILYPPGFASKWTQSFIFSKSLIKYLELQFDALQKHKSAGTSKVKRLSNRDHDEVKQMLFDKFVKDWNWTSL